MVISLLLGVSAASVVVRMLKAAPFVTEFSSVASANAAALRTGVCTVLVVGAPWDGHFKNWVEFTWPRVASALRQRVREGLIELGYLLYESGDDIKGLNGSHSSWSSYEIVVFRGGQELQPAAVSEVLRRVKKMPDAEREREIAERIDSVCGFHFQEDL